MAQFSIGDAAVAGARAVGRHWRLLLGWGFFTIMAFIGGLAVVFVLAALLALSGAGEGTPLAGLLGGLILLLTLMAAVLAVTTAAWRLLVTPEDTAGFMRLRLRRDELRFAGFSVVMIVVWALALTPAMLLEAAGGGAFPMPAFAAAVAGWVVAFWLQLRFAFTPALIVDAGRLDFAASWRMTRGRQWPLVGLALLTACIGAVFFIGYTVALGLVALATMGFSGLGALIRPDMSQPGHSAFTILQALLQVLLTPAWIVLLAAPFAHAYRSLKAGEADAF